MSFPIIGDKERKIAYAYDMLDHQDTTNVDSKGIAFTIRSVFIIDPKKTIRLILSYPASTGRNTAEVLRVIDSLQTGDKHRITTPINWLPGEFEISTLPLVAVSRLKLKNLYNRRRCYRAPQREERRGQDALPRIQDRQAISSIYPLAQGEDERCGLRKEIISFS